MNTKVPAWTLLALGIVCVFVLCGITGVVAATKPEPEIRTVTKTVTKEVKDDSQTERINELEAELTQCKSALLLSSQGFIDTAQAFVQLAESTSRLDVAGIEKATAMIEAIDSAKMGEQAKLCDSDIGSKVTGL